MKKPLFLTVFITALTATTCVAQSITVTSLSGSSFCTGEPIVIQYTAGGTFQPNNSFTAQLSDTSGSFESFTNIASVKTATSGVISAIIPAATKQGSRYRIRVVSGFPFIASADNGSDVRIDPRPDAAINTNAPYVKWNVAFVGADVTGIWTSSPGDEFFWDFGADAVPPTSHGRNPGPFHYTTAGLKTISLTASNASGCSATSTKVDIVNVVDCTPKIPSSTKIDSAGRRDSHSEGNVWVVPGGVLEERVFDVQVFVETGGSVLDDVFGVIWVKPGGVFDHSSYDNHTTVLFSQGASLVDLKDARLIECPAIVFDYSAAPVYNLINPKMNVLDGSSSTREASKRIVRGVIDFSTNSPIERYEILDLLGRIVKSGGGYRGHSLTISAPEIPAGVYVSRLYTERGVMSEMLQLAR